MPQANGAAGTQLRELRAVRAPVTDLTATQRRRMERRAKERRRVTPQAFLLRVKAVMDARRQRDKWAMIGALEDLASACLAWASYIRKTSDL